MVPSVCCQNLQCADQMAKVYKLQMYAWPALMRGLNVVGVAPSKATPPGRTYAYLLPLLTQCSQQGRYFSNLPKSNGVRQL